MNIQHPQSVSVCDCVVAIVDILLVHHCKPLCTFVWLPLVTVFINHHLHYSLSSLVNILSSHHLYQATLFYAAWGVLLHTPGEAGCGIWSTSGVA